MSNTSVPAAAEGMSAYPRNPQRIGFVRELLMRWGARAENASVNQTPVQESFMEEHRVKAQFLKDFATGKYGDLQSEDIDALLWSFLPEEDLDEAIRAVEGGVACSYSTFPSRSYPTG